jgi:hypothetical protein
MQRSCLPTTCPALSLQYSRFGESGGWGCACPICCQSALASNTGVWVDLGVGAQVIELFSSPIPQFMTTLGSQFGCTST